MSQKEVCIRQKEVIIRRKFIAILRKDIASRFSHFKHSETDILADILFRTKKSVEK